MDWLTGGRFGSCRLSAMFCIISIFAWWIFLVSSFILFFYRLKGNVLVLKMLFMVIAVLVGLIPFVWSLCVALGCFSNLNKGQFWHQDLSADSIIKYEQMLGHVIVKDRDVSDIKLMVLSGSDLRHHCIGHFNPRASGQLYIRITDPATEKILDHSDKYEAKWSSNMIEICDFDIPCCMRFGRFKEFYFVKCELWFSPCYSEADEKIAEVMVKVNGWF